MAILLMVVIVGMMLSALLVPTIVTQVRATRFDSTRVQALGAAQSGIDVILGLIRASVTSGIGDSGRLPCGPVSGVVNATEIASYSAVVEYFAADPATEPYPAPMECVAGHGTFDLASGATTPSFARFTSTGTVGAATNGSSAGRTLVATYAFRTGNMNLWGGLVQIQPSGSGSLCLDAGSATAPAGTPVTSQPCSASTPPAAQQVFAYRTDLTVQLMSSVTGANPGGLCVNSAHTPAVSGDALRLDRCGPLGMPAPYTQQWSYNDNGQYQAAQAFSATTGVLSDQCWGVPVLAVGQPVMLGSCKAGAAWVPSSSVGPGAAALPQWINYAEFGRCMDVTGQDPGHRFLIDYPCTQNPDPFAVTWPQKFQASAIPAGTDSVTGQIYTIANDQKYCLTSPGVAGRYVTVQPCGNGAQQTWSIHGGDKSLNHATKYTIVNGSLCLGLGAPDPSLSIWSTIDVENCTGAAEQKWNASPDVLSPALQNVHEE